MLPPAILKCMATPAVYKLLSPPIQNMDADTLTYPNLAAAVHEYFAEEYAGLEALYATYESSEKGVATAAVSQKQLAAIALKIVEAPTTAEKQKWSGLFTEISSALFGEPELTEVVWLASRDREIFGQFLSHRSERIRFAASTVIDAYEQFLMGTEPPANGHDDEAILLNVAGYYKQKFADVYDVMDAYDDKEILEVTTVRHIYAEMLQKLTQLDASWRSWKISAADTAQMGVSPSKQIIQIGTFLPPLPALRVKSLFTHEVLFHAYRSVNGRKYNKPLAYGLPGYMTTEEGCASLVEGAIEGHMPYRIGDRYIDIAMALGTTGQSPMSRPKLFPIVYARTLLRKIMEGAPTDDAVLQPACWQHVNRLYRGTLGNEIVGVYTKDCIYYKGYQQMVRYLKQYPAKLQTDALDFVLSGKINPQSLAHRRYLHELKFNVVRSPQGETV